MFRALRVHCANLVIRLLIAVVALFALSPLILMVLAVAKG